MRTMFGTRYPRLLIDTTRKGLDWRGPQRHTPERVCCTESPRRCRTRHTVTRYSRQDVMRILHLHARQLQAWERAGLVLSSEEYSFEALGQLRKLRDLQASTRISAKSIRASVDAMQRVAGMRNPLSEAGFVRRGSRLSFRHGGALMDPLTQQLAFDFDTSPARELCIGARVDVPARQAV